MKIAAGCIFYNSSDILPYAIENLIAHGIKDFYLMDHGSSDGDSKTYLRNLSMRANIRLISKKTDPFFQGRMMTLLALAASHDGFEIFIPFDSDEFLDVTNQGTNLISIVETEFANNPVTVRVKELDYVQNSSVEKFNEINFQTAKYVAIVSANSDDYLKQEILNGGSALARFPSQKSLINLTRVKNDSKFSISEGSHSILNYQESDSTTSSNLVIRHLPFRSKQSVMQKKSDGLRRQSAGFDAAVGFQSRQLVDKSIEYLENYWKKNSYSESANDCDLCIPSPLVNLEPDDGLIQVLDRMLTSRKSSLQTHSEAKFSLNDNLIFAEKIFAIAVDSRAGFPDLETLNSENIYLKSNLYHTELELKGVREDYEKLANAYNGVMHSVSWKLTRFIRALSASLQKIRSTKRKS